MNIPKSVDPIEATQFLKNMLNVGKAQTSPAATATTTPPPVAEEVTNGGVTTVNNNLLESLFNSEEEEKVQQIVLPGSNDQVSFPVYGQNISICPSPLHSSGSSKMKIHNLVDYKWEHKYYRGQLLAIHLSGVYLAYAISVSAGGVVRVLKQTTAERELIKGMKGDIKDLAFAFTKSPVLLAVVDELGDIFVHEVVEKNSKISCVPVLVVEREPHTSPTDYHRVIWCPYIPEDPAAAEEEAPNLLLVTNNNQAEIWNLDQIAREYGSTHFTFESLPLKGVQSIVEHTLPISDASFSPDGTALATASLDGEVKFFQVQSNDITETPRCLHQWCPHDRKPLSCLFFLDNYKVFNPDIQFWKYAITGANSNQELKLWSCETWSCLQRIRFVSRPDDDVVPCLTASIDLSSTYLLLSDINRKVLYILQIAQDFATNQVKICSLSEFPLAFPVLSLAVGDFVRCRYKPLVDALELDSNSTTAAPNSDDKESEADDLHSKDSGVEGTVAKVYWIQSRSLQMCNIVYQPPDTTIHSSSGSFSSALPDQYMYTADRLSDVSTELADVLPTSSPHLQPFKPCGEVLLTPEDFTSSADAAAAAAAAVPTEPPVASTTPRRKSSQHSSTSSPSREVEEILALKKYQPPVSQEEEEEEDEEEVTTTTVTSVTIKNQQQPVEATASSPSSWPHIPEPAAILHPTIQQPPAGDQKEEDPRHLVSTLDILKLEKGLAALGEQVATLAEHRQQDQATLQAALNHQEATLTRLEGLLAKRDGLDKQWLEKQASQLTQSFASKLDKAVKAEMKATVSPIVNKFLDELKHHIDQEVSQKLSATDTVVRDHISKLMKTKSFLDIIGNSVTGIAQSQIQNSCREVFHSTAVPAFEKACQNLFLQLNDSFQKGTREYVEQLESGMEHQKFMVQSTLDKSLTTLKDQVRQFIEQSIKTSLTSLQAFFLNQLQEQFIKNQDALLVKIKGIVQEEVKNSLQDGGMVLRSAAATPVPQMDTQIFQQQLRHLVRIGQYNTAFQQALSAADLSLVMLVCTSTSPLQVFDAKASDPLQQPVLLSLIQQLSGDLNTHTDLKLSYLQDAITCLDVNNHVTRENLSKVLGGLQQKLHAFIHANPNSLAARKMKMLLMASCSLNYSWPRDS